MPAHAFPDADEWERAIAHLSPADQRRIKRFTRGRRTAEREDEAYLVIAFAKRELDRLWIAPFWLIPTLIAASFVLRALVLGLDRAINDPIEVVFMPLLFGVLLPFVGRFRLEGAIARHTEVLERIHRDDMPTPFPEPGAAPPPFSRR